MAPPTAPATLKKDNKKDEKQQQPAKLGKVMCLVCKTTSARVASNKHGSVQCATCDRWFHPPCVNMSEDLYTALQKIQEAGQQPMWACVACESATAKLQKIANAQEKRMDGFERAQDELKVQQEEAETREQARDRKIEQQEKELRELREKVDKMAEDTGSNAIKEMDERESKNNNLVFHHILEGREREGIAKKEEDMAAIQKVLDYLKVKVVVREATRLCRRLGEVKGVGEGREEDPRPLLVGFKYKNDVEEILANCPNLRKAREETLRAVSIGKDLTLKQRKNEEEMRKRVMRKNLTRNEEEVQGGLVWKMLGRRGERREVQVKRGDGETINQEGWVVREGEEWRNRKGSFRNHSQEARGSPSGDWQRTVKQTGEGRSKEQMKDILMNLAGMGPDKLKEILADVSQGDWSPATSERRRKRKERSSPTSVSPSSSSPELKRQSKHQGATSVTKLSNQFEALASCKKVADLVNLMAGSKQVGGE